MDAIYQLIESKQLSSLIDLLQELELEYLIQGEENCYIEIVHQLLFSYLIEHDTDAFRHLLNRIPKELLDKFVLVNAIYKSICENKINKVLPIIYQQNIEPNLHSDDNFELGWSGNLQQIVNWFIDEYKYMILKGFAIGFKDCGIQENMLPGILGFNLETCHKILQENGFYFDERWFPGNFQVSIEPEYKIDELTSAIQTINTLV